MFYLYFVCVCIVGHWFHESAPSSFFLHSDIFFSLTGVCGGPRNSSAHIATLTQTHSTPSLLSSLNAPPSPSFFNSPLSLFLFLHLSLFSPIFVFLNPSLTKKKKKKQGKWPQMKMSAPEKRIRASDIIEVFRLEVPQHVEKASWAGSEGFWREHGRVMKSVRMSVGQELPAAYEWMNVCDMILRGSDYITHLGKCWKMKSPINNVASVICGLYSKGSVIHWTNWYNISRVPKKNKKKFYNGTIINNRSGNIIWSMNNWSAQWGLHVRDSTATELTLILML